MNTPWLHRDATAHIRAAIELRLTLLPYLYSCLHESVGAHRPVLRPTFFEFPDDPQCWQDNDEFLVGAELLARSLPISREARADFSGGNWK